MKRKQVHPSDTRVISHVDLDCFYVQVERSLNSVLLNKPVAVVQYNPFGDLKTLTPTCNRVVSSGSLIAVSYEARAHGVKRVMRGNEAKKVCPDLVLVQVPTNHGKADLTIYRDASARIVDTFCGRTDYPDIIVERGFVNFIFCVNIIFIFKKL